MKSNFLSFSKFIIGWPLSLLALFFVGKILLEKAPTISQIIHLNYTFLFLGILSYFLYFIFRVAFWKKLTDQKDIKTIFLTSAYRFSISEIKRYVPGNIWSFVGRAQSYSSHNISKKSFAHLLFLEILFLLVATILISLFSLNFIVYALLPHFSFDAILVNLIVFISLISTLFFLLSPHTFLKIPILGKLFPDFDIKVNIKLLSTMLGAFLFFGLGSYFSISSITPLFIPHILSLTGFFVAAFIAGYLSFITPMGLGVREGIVTYGMSKYIPLVDAASGAILSRLTLIIAELSFLGFILIWKRFQNLSSIKKIEAFFHSYFFEILVVISFALYSIYFSLTSFLRYENFFTGRFDLGNMDQTVWNTLHGRIFQLTNPDGTNIISRLAFHADFILIILSPFYIIWQDPRMLLFIQSVLLGVGGIFIYLIAKKVLNNKALSFIFAFIYFIHPAINHANLFDFHGVVLAVPFFIIAWYYLQKKNYLISTVFLLLAGTTKEEVWVIVGLFGILLFLKQKRILGTILAIISFCLFYFLFFKAIPLAHGGNHFALSYYSDFGSSAGTVIKNMLLSPIKVISVATEPDRLWYIFQLFFPFGFLSIFAPLFLIFSGPDLAVSLLSQNNQLHNIVFHYAAIVIPFVTLSSIYGTKFLLKKYPQIPTFYLGLFLLATSITAAYWYGPLPGARNMNDAMYIQQLPYKDAVDEFLQTIPRQYSVAATNNVGSHLSHRQNIYTIPIGMEKADVIVFLLNDQFAQPSLEAQREFAMTLSKDPNYVKVYEYQDFVLFTKKGLPLAPLRRSRHFLPPLFH
ncbi:MAG TPA: DUF2079 domain-containing protein [Patescibacteria group bacterium]